jgi:hypothetical protein
VLGERNIKDMIKILITFTILLLVPLISFAQSQGPQESTKKATNANKNSYSHQQGTEERPFVIKTIPTPPSKDATDNEAYQARTKPIYELLGTVATILIAITTIGLAFLNIGLWRATKKAAEAAKLSADAVVRIESPIIRIYGSPMFYKMEGDIPYEWKNYPKGPARIGNLHFINYGRTPAFPYRLDGGWAVKDKLPDMPDYIKSTLINPDFIIFPDKEKGDAVDEKWAITFTREQEGALKDNSAWLWFYVCLHYWNFMNERQEARFCWKLMNVPGFYKEGPNFNLVLATDAPEAYTKST